MVPEASPEKEQPSVGTPVAGEVEALNFKAAARQEGGGEIAESPESLRRDTSPAAHPHPGPGPGAPPQGHVVQVKERFQGEVRKAHLVLEPRWVGAGLPGDSLEEGTTVIARLLDNPAEKNCEKAVSRLVGFRRTGAGSSRAVLLPLQREAAVGGEQGEGEEPSRKQELKKSVPSEEADGSLEASEREDGNESVSSATWASSWMAEVGTVSELSTPSPMVDQVDGHGFERPLRLLPATRSKLAAKRGAGSWAQPGAELPASQSVSSVSGPSAGTVQRSSGYGSDSSHRPAEDAGRALASPFEDGCTLSAEADSRDPSGRTDKGASPAGSRVSTPLSDLPFRKGCGDGAEGGRASIAVHVVALPFPWRDSFPSDSTTLSPGVTARAEK